jgi:hypothetical protein
MIPPRLVRKIRPSGAVPYLLMWARSSFTRSGGMGMVLVSCAARCGPAPVQEPAAVPRNWRLGYAERLRYGRGSLQG